jgi:ankyrin repeat protein
MVANQLADRGWHDVWVLVEWSSRGYAAYPYPYPYYRPRIWAGFNIWQISIYREQAPAQQPPAAAAPPAVSAPPAKAAPPAAENSDIFKIVSTGTPIQVKAAIKSGADPNARDSRGGTPLMYAASDNANPAVITALVQAGADPNARRKDGMTALMYAAEENTNPVVVATLLDAGADARAKDDAGSTALDYAASNSSLTGTDAYRQLQAASQ